MTSAVILSISQSTFRASPPTTTLPLLATVHRGANACHELTELFTTDRRLRIVVEAGDNLTAVHHQNSVTQRLQL